MLELIIPQINEKVGDIGMFENLHGLCEIIKRDDKSFPAEYCNGEYKQVSDFDLSRGFVYHRLIDKVSTEKEDEDNTISCDPFYKRTFPLRLVASIKKDLIKPIGNDAYLENKISHNIIGAISKANTKTLRTLLKGDLNIEIDNLILNRDDLFRQEYDGYDNFIRYEFLYIAIDYNVIITGNVSCFDLYNC